MEETIDKMINEAFAKGHWEDDDTKRAAIYGKCLSAIQKLVMHETDTKQG